MEFEWSLETFLTLFEKLVFFVSVREYWPLLAWKWWREGKTKQETAPQRDAVAILDYLTFSWFKQLSLEFVLGKFSLQSPVWYNKHIHKQHITSILCYIRELSNKQVTTTQKHSSLLDICSQRAHSSVAEVDKTSHQRAPTTSLIKGPIETKSRLARREKQRISFGPLAAHELWYIYLSCGTGPYLRLASPPAYKIH